MTPRRALTPGITEQDRAYLAKFLSSFWIKATKYLVHTVDYLLPISGDPSIETFLIRVSLPSRPSRVSFLI